MKVYLLHKWVYFKDERISDTFIGVYATPALADKEKAMRQRTNLMPNYRVSFRVEEHNVIED